MPLFAEYYPAFAVHVLELFGGDILLQVDRQHPLDFFLAGLSGMETGLLQILQYPCQECVAVVSMLLSQADKDIEFPRSRHLHLEAVELLGVLLQRKYTYRRMPAFRGVLPIG